MLRSRFFDVQHYDLQCKQPDHDFVCNDGSTALDRYDVDQRRLVGGDRLPALGVEHPDPMGSE